MSETKYDGSQLCLLGLDRFSAIYHKESKNSRLKIIRFANIPTPL